MSTGDVVVVHDEDQPRTHFLSNLLATIMDMSTQRMQLLLSSVDSSDDLRSMYTCMLIPHFKYMISYIYSFVTNKVIYLYLKLMNGIYANSGKYHAIIPNMHT